MKKLIEFLESDDRAHSELATFLMSKPATPSTRRTNCKPCCANARGCCPTALSATRFSPNSATRTRAMSDRIPPDTIFRVYFLYANTERPLRDIGEQFNLAVRQANWCVDEYLRDGRGR